MSQVDRWLAANGAYLNRELTLLRRRIGALAERADDLASLPPTTAVHPRAAGLRRWFHYGPSSSKAEPVAPPVDALAGPEATEDATEAIDSREPRYAPALTVLAQRLGLSEFERQLLLMCAAMEFDTGFGALCARAQPGSGNKGPTFELALAALDNPAWDVLSPERPLRYWRLIEIHQPAAQPLVSSALRADERIVNYIKGLNYLDDRLAPLVESIADDGDTALPPSQSAIADAITAHLADGIQPPLFQLLGDSAASKLAVARAVAAQAGTRLYRLRGDAAPTAQGESETFVRLWQREAALLPLALYIDAEDIEPAHVQAVERLLNRCGGLVFVASARAWRDVARPTTIFEVAKPLAAEQHQLWRDALGAEGDHQAALLAGQFNLDQAAIDTIVLGATAASE